MDDFYEYNLYLSSIYVVMYAHVFICGIISIIQQLYINVYY